MQLKKIVYSSVLLMTLGVSSSAIQTSMVSPVVVDQTQSEKEDKTKSKKVNIDLSKGRGSIELDSDEYQTVTIGTDEKEDFNQDWLAFQEYKINPTKIDWQYDESSNVIKFGDVDLREMIEYRESPIEEIGSYEHSDDYKLKTGKLPLEDYWKDSISSSSLGQVGFSLAFAVTPKNLSTVDAKNYIENTFGDFQEGEAYQTYYEKNYFLEIPFFMLNYDGDLVEKVTTTIYNGDYDLWLMPEYTNYVGWTNYGEDRKLIPSRSDAFSYAPIRYDLTVSGGQDNTNPSDLFYSKDKVKLKTKKTKNQELFESNSKYNAFSTTESGGYATKNENRSSQRSNRMSSRMDLQYRPETDERIKEMSMNFFFGTNHYNGWDINPMKNRNIFTNTSNLEVANYDLIRSILFDDFENFFNFNLEIKNDDFKEIVDETKDKFNNLEDTHNTTFDRYLAEELIRATGVPGQAAENWSDIKSEVLNSINKLNNYDSSLYETVNGWWKDTFLNMFEPRTTSPGLTDYEFLTIQRVDDENSVITIPTKCRLGESVWVLEQIDSSWIRYFFSTDELKSFEENAMYSESFSSYVQKEGWYSYSNVTSTYVDGELRTTIISDSEVLVYSITGISILLLILIITLFILRMKREKSNIKIIKEGGSNE